MTLKLKLFLFGFAVSIAVLSCKSESIQKNKNSKNPVLRYFQFVQQCKIGASTLAAEKQTCEVKSGVRFAGVLHSLEGRFYRVQLAELALSNCTLSLVYIPDSCVNVTNTAPTTPVVSPSATTTITAKITPSMALLNVVAYAEGTPKFGTENGYNVMFTGRTFSGYQDHPRRIMVSGGYRSDAAGRYQFLSSTWDGVKRAKSLSNFEPKNQDIGGLSLMEEKGLSNHALKMSRSEFRTAIAKIGKVWASLPGSPYGQPIKSLDELWGVYEKQYQ
jgi:muramidase (phage lysozyme)